MKAGRWTPPLQRPSPPCPPWSCSPTTLASSGFGHYEEAFAIAL